MEKINDGGPAFGGSYDEVFYHIEGKTELQKIEARARGMSLRDWLAGQALAGELASQPKGEFLQEQTLENASLIARRAYRFSDAMLKAREDKPCQS